MLYLQKNFQLQNGLLLGIYNFNKQDLLNFQYSLSTSSVYSDKIKYLEITKDIINAKIEKERIKAMSTNKKKNKFGFISNNWLIKYQTENPSVIVQLYDITKKIEDDIEPALIAEEILFEMSKIKNVFISSTHILLIKDLLKSNYDDTIKQIILSSIKLQQEKNIIIINDVNYFADMKNFIEHLNNELNIYYDNLRNKYESKMDEYNSSINREYSIKYLIKLFIISFITQNDNIKVNYSYLFSGYNLLKHKLGKINNIKNFYEQVSIYFELKNIGDFIVYQLTLRKNGEYDEVKKLTDDHLNFFDCKNFYNNSNENCGKLIILLNLMWKLAWYKYLENSFLIQTDIYILTKIIFQLFVFTNKEQIFIENEIINKYKSLKIKILNNKYIEKIPIYNEVNEKYEITKEFSFEENFILYMNRIILKNIDVINMNELNKNMEYVLKSLKYNTYFFYLIYKYDILNQKSPEFIYFFIKKCFYDNNFKKFNKSYSHFLDFVYKTVIDVSYFDNKIKTEMIIDYLNYSKNETIEKCDQINNLLNLNGNLFDIIINNTKNELFDVCILYNDKKQISDDNLPAFLDCINIKVIIKVKKEGIIFHINKIKIIFYDEVYKNYYLKNKIFHEIIINNSLSKESGINICYNYLNKYSITDFFSIKNVILILNNNSTINIKLNQKKNKKCPPLIYEKNFEKIAQKSIELLGRNNNNSKIIIGEKENYCHSIKYQKNIKNKLIVISNIRGNIAISEKKYANNNLINNITLRSKNIDNNNSNDLKSILFDINSNISDCNIHSFDFLVQINQPGDYKLVYEIDFSIENLNCPNEIYFISKIRTINIKCICPFSYKNIIYSSLYSIKENDKIYPTNHKIKLKNYIKNKLPRTIIIKNIKTETENQNINISSLITKIINKSKKIINTNEEIVIPFDLIINDVINDKIGMLKIFWTTEELNNFGIKNLNNETIIYFSSIITNNFQYSFDGRFIQNNNESYYEFKIKNLNKSSRLIKCELVNGDTSVENYFKEEDDNDIIIFGKTIDSQILIPKKEMIFLFYLRDKNTDKLCLGKRFRKKININEYCINNNPQKFDDRYLINEIYFIPDNFI